MKCDKLNIKEKNVLLKFCNRFIKKNNEVRSQYPINEINYLRYTNQEKKIVMENIFHVYAINHPQIYIKCAHCLNIVCSVNTKSVFLTMSAVILPWIHFCRKCVLKLNV